MSSQDKDHNNYEAAPIPERLRKDQKVAIITADKTEDLECFYPYYRLSEEGYQVDVITIKGGAFKGKNNYGLNETKAITDVNPQDYALVYIPGGSAPSELRKDENVLNFVKEFALSGKPLAAICHGAQVLISANLVKGRKIAAWPEIRNEVEEAGATFVDEALVEDGQFITSRKPGDLHRHMYGVMNFLKAGVTMRDSQPRKHSAA